MSAAVATWGSFDQDIARSRKRVRFTMGTSVVLHALLALWIVFHRTEEMRGPELTEIMLIDPSELAAPAPASAPAAAGAVSLPGMPRADKQDEAFKRLERRGDVAPEPQALAFSDKLNERLSELRSTKPSPVAGAALNPVPSAILTSPTVVAGNAGNGSSPVSLRREGADGPALSLSRGPGVASGASAAMLPSQVRQNRATEEAAPATGEGTVHKQLAGATLAGPIADRAVLSHPNPIYPDWAKRDAVEGSVTLYFVVRPDGSVKENVLVQKTAGFEDFDENARAALRTWRFEALQKGRTGEQWGTITFRFRLQDTN